MPPPSVAVQIPIATSFGAVWCEMCAVSQALNALSRVGAASSAIPEFGGAVDSHLSKEEQLLGR